MHYCDCFDSLEEVLLKFVIMFVVIRHFVFIDRFVILYVMARDEDEGENGRVSYRIQAGNSAGRFSLNPNTGETQHLKI